MQPAYPPGRLALRGFRFAPSPCVGTARTRPGTPERAAILRRLVNPDGQPAPAWPADLPAPPATGRPRRLPRGAIHLLLLALTAATMTLGGSLWHVVDEARTPLDVVRIYLTRPGVLLHGIPFALYLLAILGAHEMGHYLACRYYRIPATLPFFIPGPPPFGTFGAVIRIRGIVPHRRALFDVAAAGPLAGYAVALPVLLVGLLRAEPVSDPTYHGFVISGEPVLVSAMLRTMELHETTLRVGAPYLAGWFGMLITSMNLFPVGQLDGGHVAYALSGRLHRRLAWLTLLLLLGLVLLQPLWLGSLSLYTLWFLILLWMRDRHPRLADERPGLGAGRRLTAVLLLLIFVTSFIPIPQLLLLF